MLPITTVVAEDITRRSHAISRLISTQPPGPGFTAPLVDVFTSPSVNNPVAILPTTIIVATDSMQRSHIISRRISTQPSASVFMAPYVIRQPQDIWPKVSIEQWSAALIAIGTRERMQGLCREIVFGNKLSMAKFLPLTPKSKDTLSPPLHWLGVISCEVAVINVFIFQRLLSKLEQKSELLVAKNIEMPLVRLLRKNLKKLNFLRPLIFPHVQLSPIDSATKNLITRTKKLAMDPMTQMSALNRAGLFVAKDCSMDSPNPQIHSFVVSGFLNSHPWLVNSARNICQKLLSNPSHHPSELGPGISLTAEAPYNVNNVQVNVRRKAYLRAHFGKDTRESLFHRNDTVTRHIYGTGCGSVTHGAPKW